MTKKNTKNVTPDDLEIEVVMTKKMKFGDYNKVRNQGINKGWNVKSYQIGFFSIGFKKEIE